ncbi:hypothetical protein V2G26_009763 [Clonostachys chloroleuca]|uniref:DUF427 domain-containing protein n=1 Tax=Clonostachys chloroleuca TaxID=1926264 RepID=A0AA35LZZ5_9HYPO|nr:unnamed protein product [Clonostachys chloroleuca]
MVHVPKKLNVQSFPRPPRLEQVSRHIKVIWEGQEIANTENAYWVLETHHPPTYYLPPSSIKIPLTPTDRQTWCEWKGAATYYTVQSPLNGSVVSNRIWSYERPTDGFAAIKGYLSLYAGPWECFVDGEKVKAQPGDFYGGWVTSEVEGIIKGRNGNWDPL